MKKYYLGLDIEIGSVGWGIIGEEEGKHWLEDFGVRLFSVPEEPENKKSLAEKRRGFRSQRRLLNRWHCRREDLKKFFGKIFGSDFLQEFENFAKKSTNFLPADLEKYEEESEFFNPYVVRYQALNNKIGLADLLKILLHLGKYRGYWEFYLDDSSEEKEVKEAQTAVRKTEKLFQEKKYETVAEMVIKEGKFRHSQNKNLLSAHNHNPSKTYENKEEKEKNHRHFIFPRKLLEAETDKILAKQSEYYPQLRNNFQWKLWKNGKLETKEFSAQEIIKAIIFRQRDFEDGPSQTEPKNQEKPAIIHWKKHNRNITFNPFAATTGSCQYFPTEKRGWRCSLVFCLYQFINEFSKIGGLEIKEIGAEKVKEIHQTSLNWVLSTSGYQPKNSSNQEKKSGTFRQQLEKFLKELQIKPRFPTGIEFKVSFLDYLKEDKNFYSVLGKDCPSQFYLNYEDYQKTVFYQMGEIIFADISPWRRKDKLTELAEKYSLEPFSDCLSRLEKYYNEKSPAAVSFRYMIEAIKAFLEGEKYGEFQAWCKEKILKESVSVKEKDKGMWSPWMHPDLVRNPVVFRSFNETRKILKNLFLRYPEGFATINIETGRDLWNSEEERNKIERKNRDREKEKEGIRQKLRDSNSDIPPNEENIKRYRLWEDQNEKLWSRKSRKKKPTIKETNAGGICLYCGQEIDLYNLKNTDIDHIIPQSRWADDSFNNLTLTHPACNKAKDNRLPFHFFKANKPESVFKKEWKDFKKRVDKLYKIRNPFKHKFLTLGEEENWENELEDFVSRNLNDTRMIATYLARYIQNELNKKEEFRTKIATKEMKVQSIKGSMTSYFRKQLLQYKEKGKWQLSPFYYKEQLRSLTPYHHAIDAIVLAHFKSRAYIQLLGDLTKISQGQIKIEKRKNYLRTIKFSFSGNH